MRTNHQRREAVLRHVADGHFTAQQLGEALGVSVRTIYRDVKVLRGQGHTIVSASGQRGGFWLHHQSQPLPVSLSAEAIRELVLLGPAAGVSTNTLRALLDCLPVRARAELEAVLSATDWGPRESVPAVNPTVRADVIEAFARRIPLRIRYRLAPEEHGKGAAIVLRPVALRERDGVWTLAGRGVRGKDRQVVTEIRLDRILRTRFRRPWSAIYDSTFRPIDPNRNFRIVGME